MPARHRLLIGGARLRRSLATMVATIVLAACCVCTANADSIPLSQARSAFKTRISLPSREPGAPAQQLPDRRRLSQYGCRHDVPVAARGQRQSGAARGIL
jgi:hypothetical protein